MEHVEFEFKLMDKIKALKKENKRLEKGIDDIWFNHTYHEGKNISNLCKDLLSKNTPT